MGIRNEMKMIRIRIVFSKMCGHNLILPNYFKILKKASNMSFMFAIFNGITQMSLRVNMLLFFKYFKTYKHFQTDELVEVVCSQNEKLATFKDSILESICEESKKVKFKF